MSGIEQVRAFVGRRRKRWMVRHASVSAAALISAIAAALVAGPAAEGILPAAATWAGRLFASLVGVYALAGLIKAIVSPPSDADVALWVEQEVPPLKDSLITAMEGGALASTSAGFAMARLRATPLASSSAGRSHGSVARTRLVWSSSAVLAACFVIRIMTQLTLGERAAPQIEPVVVEEEFAEVEVFSLPTAQSAPEYVPLFGVVAPDRAATNAAARGSSVRAADILLSSPPGYERAVELYISGQEHQRK